MNAINSLVKTLWIVMAALVLIGFLTADRLRLVEELAKSEEEVAALQAQLSQQGEHCRVTQARLGQALTAVQTQLTEAETQVFELQQTLDGERKKLGQTELEVTLLRQQLEVCQQALADEREKQVQIEGQVAAPPPQQEMVGNETGDEQFQEEAVIEPWPSWSGIMGPAVWMWGTVGILSLLALLGLMREYPGRRPLPNQQGNQLLSARRHLGQPLTLRPMGQGEKLRSRQRRANQQALG